jgi:hypothetical protein
MAGPRSLDVKVIRDANVARMIAAGLGTIFDDVGQECAPSKALEAEWGGWTPLLAACRVRP